MGKEKIPWFPAFVQALQLEFEGHEDSLEFRTDYRIPDELLRTDAIVLKKKAGVTIDKSIARIFRTYNIIEFKGQRDSFSAGDLYKAYAYVFLYAGTKSVDITDCSLTIIGTKGLSKLTEYAQETPNGCVEQPSAGVYYVREFPFPAQIVEIEQLSEQENLWLNKLRDVPHK